MRRAEKLKEKYKERIKQGQKDAILYYSFERRTMGRANDIQKNVWRVEEYRKKLRELEKDRAHAIKRANECSEKLRKP